MGLDTVYILLKLEERFEIRIDEYRFTQSVLVEDIITIVLDELKRTGREVADKDLGLIQFQVCDIIASELGFEPIDVQPKMRLVEDLGV